MHQVEELAAALDQAGIHTESLTVLLVTGSTPESVLDVLGADPSPLDPAAAAPYDPEAPDPEELSSAWSAVTISGGVLAIEQSGYADPATEVLARLSADGAAALARSNVKVQERVGWARHGEVVFDADEWDMLPAEEVHGVPPEVRELFDSAWSDLDGDPEDDPDVGDVFAVGLAMAVTVTGLSVRAEDLRRVRAADQHAVPLRLD